MADNTMREMPDLPAVAAGIRTLAAIGRDAWREGLMAGFSGNLSMRIGREQILITASGAAKGRLGPEDFALLNSAGAVLAGAGPSSESGLHLAIYAAFEQCSAIVHTHPARMQALELSFLARQRHMAGEFLNIDLYEAEIWRQRLVYAEHGQPGSAELVQGAVAALRAALPGLLPCAVWLPRHGLCALGQNPRQALGISEELEHLAGVQLISG